MGRKEVIYWGGCPKSQEILKFVSKVTMQQKFFSGFLVRIGKYGIFLAGVFKILSGGEIKILIWFWSDN